MRIAAFTRYGPRAASTRQRFVQYFPLLRDAGIEVDHYPLFDDDYVAALVTGERYPRTAVASAYARRLRLLAEARRADLIWVYVELLPYLPAMAEAWALRGKPVVYDIDDAFFHAYDQSGNPLVRALLDGKHAALFRNAAAVVCGNAYLREFAARFCPNSITVPTVVDTDRYRPAPAMEPGAPTIGWIGSPATWCGVQPVLPVLAGLCASHGARFLVVGAGHAADADRFPEMEIRDWSEATEIADVQEMDVGIMPLLDRPFERGKSGYKLIQYMACGLPVVASPVGVNADIVKEGGNGFLASTGQEWGTSLAKLLEDSNLRRSFGANGRKLAVERFSLASQGPRLVELFRSLA